MIVPRGYSLSITDSHGSVVESIDLTGYDLDKQMARSLIMDNISDAVRFDFGKKTSEAGR